MLYFVAWRWGPNEKAIAVLGVSAVLSGCASSAASIQGAYVSPLQYSNYDCDQIRAELLRVSSRVHAVSGEQDRKRRHDQIATGVGVVLFWPALFLLASGDQKAELQRLKGEYDALDAASIQKKCAIASEMHAQSAAK